METDTNRFVGETCRWLSWRFLSFRRKTTAELAAPSASDELQGWSLGVSRENEMPMGWWWHLWHQTSDSFQDPWAVLHCCFPKGIWSCLLEMSSIPNTGLPFFLETESQLWPLKSSLSVSCGELYPCGMCVSNTEHLSSLSSIWMAGINWQGIA